MWRWISAEPTNGKERAAAGGDLRRVYRARTMADTNKKKKENLLRGAVGGLTPKTLAPVFFGAGALLLLLRVWQTQSLMDPETGFFISREHPSILVFYVLAVALLALPPVGFYLGRQEPVGRIRVSRSVPHGVACLLSGAALGYELLARLPELTSAPDAASITVSAAAVQRVLQAYLLFTALSAVCFILDGVAFLTGSAFGEKLRILRLAPVFWAFFRTVRFFSVTASYLHATQLFLTIFSSAVLMLFLFYYARKTANILPQDNTAGFLASGVISAVLLFTVGVTDLLLQLTKHTAFPYCGFTPFSLTLGLFCVTALGLAKKAAAEDTIPTEPLPEE